MKQRLTFLLRGWTVARLIRLTVGIIFLVWAIYEREWMLGLLAGIFLLQAFMNRGCGSDGCSF